MHTEFLLEDLKERDYWHIQTWMGNNIEIDLDQSASRYGEFVV